MVQPILDAAKVIAGGLAGRVAFMAGDTKDSKRALEKSLSHLGRFDRTHDYARASIIVKVRQCSPLPCPRAVSPLFSSLPRSVSVSVSLFLTASVSIAQPAFVSLSLLRFVESTLVRHHVQPCDLPCPTHLACVCPQSRCTGPLRPWQCMP